MVGALNGLPASERTWGREGRRSDRRALLTMVDPGVKPHPARVGAVSGLSSTERTWAGRPAARVDPCLATDNRPWLSSAVGLTSDLSRDRFDVDDGVRVSGVGCRECVVVRKVTGDFS